MGTRSGLEPAEEAGDVRSERRVQHSAMSARRAVSRPVGTSGRSKTAQSTQSLSSFSCPHISGTHTLPAISRLCRFSLSRVLTS